MDDRGEISDYVLGELDAPERARFESRLRHSAALRAEVERLQALVGQLEGLPSAAWEHVGSDAAPVGAPVRSLSRRRRRRPGGSLRPAAFATAGALVAAVVVVAVLASGSSSTPAHTVLLSALSGAPPSSRATATITAAERVQVNVEHLRPTDPSHYYELWLMTDTTHLLPVASFKVNSSGAARLSLALPAPPKRFRYLNISLQRQGAGGSISNVSLLRGPTT